MDGAATPAGQRAILIAGPTASGKSALAVEVAEQCGGIVINADAMQVYADLAILTARPSQDDMRGVPHALFGHVDAATPYSVGAWLRDLAPLLAAAARVGRTAVVVGGTGLYFKALTQGISALPDIPDEIRTRLRQEAETTPVSALHARLAAVDPATAARLRPTDPQRILRALEVHQATGLSLASLQATREAPVLSLARAAAVVVDVPRAELNARIDARFRKMMTEGALGEVARLAARDLDPALPAMRALGVPQLLGATETSPDLRARLAAAMLASRQYAKRQMTFARHQLTGFTVAGPHQARQHLQAWARSQPDQ